jgi:hypothetical protein
MAWSTSGTSNISTAAMLSILNGNANTSGAQVPFYTASGTTSFHGDTVNVALYNGNPTSATASSDTLAHNVYLAAGGQWVAANELATTGGYTIGGIAVTPKAETFTSNVVTFTSSGTPNWTAASFSSYGCLVYDNTIAAAKYVYCWNYFGGIQTVTSGTFTINWNASGIFAVTCT